MLNLLAKVFGIAARQDQTTPQPRWDPPAYWHSGGRQDQRFASKYRKHTGFW